MLRITVLSLLLGALALIAGLTLFFTPPEVPGQQISPIIWNASNAPAELGAATFNDGKLLIELNRVGVGSTSLSIGGIEAAAYPFLHLALDKPSNNLRVLISWKTSEKEHNSHTYRLENKSTNSLWLATSEFPGWTGHIKTLRLVFFGRSGETVRVRDFSIFPTSPSRQLQAIVSDLTSYVPWKRAAMNSHTGVTKVSSFYPAPLMAAYLILSLLSYGLLLLLFRATLKFNWSVVALLFLTCWISLDLVWQNQLLRQLADTYREFSGKSSQEKLAVGPDAQLYNFAAQVKPLLETKDARIFVDSGDKYRGQRGAYFLYPFNVYWREPFFTFPHTLPHRDLMHSGDYIVLIKPTELGFNLESNELFLPHRMPMSAELIFSDHTGTVVRLK
jgi:hypothetical protein